MRVAPLVVCALGAGVDPGRYGGGGEIIFVELDRCAHAGEGPFDSHDAHVLGGKLYLSVHRIHGPAHCPLSIHVSCRYNYPVSNSMPAYFPFCNYCATIRVCGSRPWRTCERP